MAKNLIWTILKAISQYLDFFLHPQIPDFQIVVSQPNITLIYSLLNVYIHKLYKSQFRKTDPYDWFYGPGSHLYTLLHIIAKLSCKVYYSTYNTDTILSS